MKDDIPRLVPIWLLPMVILIIFSLMQCGCRTGGTTLNTSSSGIKSVVSSSNLVRQSNGVYRIEPVQSAPQSKQVKLSPAKSRPKPTPAVSAKPVDVPPVVSGVGKSTPLKPTVSSSKNQKLPPLNPKVNVVPLKPKEPAKLIEGDGGCVKPEIAGPCEAEPNDEAVIVSWFDLILFYLTCAVGFLVLWLSCALYRDWRKKKTKGKK
jgi:hypothetical protein